MKTYILISFLILLLLISSCTSKTNTQSQGPPMPPIGETKTFNIEANNFAFSPNSIEVNKGDTVVLNIKSLDTNHGFYLKDFNVDKELPVGEEVQVKFFADKSGTFKFRCNVPCGSGHLEMTGTLIVK